MDTSTLPPQQGTVAGGGPHTAPPAVGVRSRGPAARRPAGLGAEVRESLMLLGFAVATTVGLTTAAQAALALLG